MIPATPVFQRFQSAVPNRHGRFPGVFALVNGLRDEGRLAPRDAAWVSASNRRADALYADPTSIVANCYDPVVNPGARSWFRASATVLIEFAAEYLVLLDRYDVAWVELRTASPGRISCADDVQIVAVPPTYPADWPFSTPAA